MDQGAELVLHVGDISYANGNPGIWETFMDYIEPYACGWLHVGGGWGARQGMCWALCMWVG